MLVLKETLHLQPSDYQLWSCIHILGVRTTACMTFINLRSSIFTSGRKRGPTAAEEFNLLGKILLFGDIAFI